MNKTFKNQTAKLALIAISLISVNSAFVPAAHAGMTDAYVVDQLQSSRSQLIRKETQLLRDQDDLRKQLDDLRRRNDGNVNSGSISDLSRRLDKNYSDLRQTQMAIKDVERVLL